MTSRTWIAVAGCVTASVVLSAQAPSADAVRNWALPLAAPIVIDDHPLAEAWPAQMASLRPMIGDARVVAMGEPFHGAHEPLAFRNRLIQYCVAELGFTAVALETGFSTSKTLYDYVLGTATTDDATLAAAFSYGFGAFRENIDLFHWLRAHNASRPVAQRVRLYGIDLTGQNFPVAYRSVERVLAYLGRSSDALPVADATRFAELTDVLRSDRFPLLSASARDDITARLSDLESHLRRHRIDLLRTGTLDDYEWALRQAQNASLDAAFMRLLTPEILQVRRTGAYGVLASRPAGWLDVAEAREYAMAENLRWVVDREGARGRVVAFAHNLHLQAEVEQYEATLGPFRYLTGRRPAGMFMRSMFGRDLLTVGTYFGTAIGFPKEEQPLPVGQDDVESRLASLGLKAFLLDPRRDLQSGPVPLWLNSPQRVRGGDSGDVLAIVRPTASHDLLLYIDQVTPVRSN